MAINIGLLIKTKSTPSFFPNKKTPRQRSSFGSVLFRHCLHAFGADFFSDTVDFLRLQIDAEFSKSFDVRMADLVAGRGSSSANCAYFTHDRESHIVNRISRIYVPRFTIRDTRVIVA